jgi:hypothetical protein
MSSILNSPKLRILRNAFLESDISKSLYSANPSRPTLSRSLSLLHTAYCPKTFRSSASHNTSQNSYGYGLEHPPSLNQENSLCCVKSNPYLFFSVTRCLEYLSSGENLAGCADLVTSPDTTLCRVYMRLPLASRVYMRCMLSDY